VDADAGRLVAVFGAYDVREGTAAYETARRAGRALAELGCGVLTGGYGGAMEASSRGAKEAGGRTVGVTCAIWDERANRYIDRCVRTRDLAERVAQMIELATGGFVVLPGANGTLAELALVWERKSLGLLGDRPIVCLGRFWEPLIEMMRSVRPASAEGVRLVDDPSGLAAVFGRA